MVSTAFQCIVGTNDPVGGKPNNSIVQFWDKDIDAIKAKLLHLEVNAEQDFPNAAEVLTAFRAERRRRVQFIQEVRTFAYFSLIWPSTVVELPDLETLAWSIYN